MVTPLMKLLAPVFLVRKGIVLTPPPRETAGISEGRKICGSGCGKRNS